MSFLGKTYTFVRQENFDGFLKFVGIPDEEVGNILKFTPDQKLVKDGDSYTYITATPEGPQETKFKSGVEFDDVIGSDKSPVKTTYTVDGNTVSQKVIGKAEQGVATFKREYNGDDLVVVKSTYVVDGNTVTQTITNPSEPGKATFKREYNGDELVVIITTDKWDGVAKRFYKAA